MELATQLLAGGLGNPRGLGKSLGVLAQILDEPGTLTSRCSCIVCLLRLDCESTASSTGHLLQKQALQHLVNGFAELSNYHRSGRSAHWAAQSQH